jgi:hypothetical protein
MRLEPLPGLNKIGNILPSIVEIIKLMFSTFGQFSCNEQAHLSKENLRRKR